ncbi:TBC1 domain family member 23-like [Antedon mediterranea]|uniref:TBC1 domain family member 23-like n=1 Tax=Antedon mediterranea TaxID=105859 RepID=UPI003AF93F5F
MADEAGCEVLEDTSWHQDLEDALAECCDFGALRNICKGRQIPDHYVAESWKICLNVAKKGDSLATFDGIFDLEDQDQLRIDCKEFVDKFDNTQAEKLSLASDIESVVTFYCKSKNVKYDKKNGWLEILSPFVALKMDKCDLYNCFYAVMTRFVPRDRSSYKKCFHLFRLLLMYHEPELCNFLDTKRISPESYTKKWFASVFAGNCDADVVQSMWNVYFLQADPFLIFFLGLVILVNAKDHIFTLSGEGNQVIIDSLANFPDQLEAEDVDDFCSLAQYYASKTPQSFRRDYQSMFGGTNTKDRTNNLSHELCLQVNVSELVQSTSQASADSVTYFVVDCRPAEQYNSGHLPTAFHLDANLMLQQPSEFASAVKALSAAQQQAVDAGSDAAGEHLCFMGSGREEEDQYVHMVVANFLQKKSQYVSIASGGFDALHKLLEKELATGLTGHSITTCIVCRPEMAQSEEELCEDMSQPTLAVKGAAFMGKLTSTLKSKSATVKDKMIDFIKNEVSQEDRHVSSEVVGKRYKASKMQPVFTIADDDDDNDGSSSNLSDDDRREVVNIETWLKKPEVKYKFKCQEVRDNGFMSPCNLLTTDTHMYILRDIPDRKGFAHITARRALASVAKITSKKRCPELITFKYGFLENDVLKLVSYDRLFITNAGEATKLIKQQIMTVIDSQ